MYLILMLYALCLLAIVDAYPIRPEWCTFLADRGPCHKNLHKFAYDSSIERCVKFSYGGCGGNPNRFSSRDECRDVCNAPLDDEDVFIFTKRRHTTQPTLNARSSKGVTSVKEVSVTEDDTNKRTTAEKEAFTIFNVIQFG